MKHEGLAGANVISKPGEILVNPRTTFDGSSEPSGPHAGISARRVSLFDALIFKFKVIEKY